MIQSLYKLIGLVSLLAVALIAGACPKRLVGGYEIKNGKVIFNQGMKGLGTTHSFEVEDADPETFEILNRDYGRDAEKAFYLGKAIIQSHGPSFEIFEDPYTKDRAHVYYAGKIISKKPKTFKFLFSVRSGSKTSKYYTDGENVIIGKSKYLPGVVDVDTFEQIGRTSYLRDKNNVYRFGRIVESADPKTFEMIRRKYDEYARDRNSVFYNGVRVEDCDRDTHRIIDEFHHKDSKNVFFRTFILSGDPENFEILSRAYTRDSKSVYWRAKKISDDAGKFVAFPSERAAAYAKDSRNAYWGWKVIEEADLASFKGLNHNYAKDKDRVYFAVNTLNTPKVVKDADPETFELVEGEKGIDARDKNNKFNFGHIRRGRK